MSCHNIGHGLNEVVRKVLVECDAGLIPYESAFRILKQCEESVFCCDGNKDEATACMYDRCGRCLQKGLPMFDLRASYDEENWTQFKKDWGRLEKGALGDHLCQDCVNELGIQKLVDGPWDVERQARYDYHG